MQKRVRYLLILLGVVCFAVLAPIVVFYVQGRNFNFESFKTQNTGILAIRSDPAGAQVWLNNKTVDTTQANIRFLNPGDYQLKLSKEGYFDWQKKLSVKPGKVTWAGLKANQIYLLLKAPAPEVLASEVYDFQISPPNFYYLSKDSLVMGLGRDFANAQKFLLPKAVSQVNVSADNKFLLLRDAKTLLIFDTAAHKFWDISPQASASSRLDFDGDGQLWTLLNNQLFKLDWQSGNRLSWDKNVLAFYILRNKIYYLKKAGAGLELRLAENLDPLGPAKSALLASLPKFNSAQLWVNSLKQVFILADGGLYKLNRSLDLLAGQVTQWYPDAQTQNLIFTTPSELSYFDALDNDVHFVSRSDAAFGSPKIGSQIGYAFFTQNSRLIALDLEEPNPANYYALIKTGGAEKTYLDADQKTLWILDGQTLKSLRFR